jgi:hypothetical protein
MTKSCLLNVRQNLRFTWITDSHLANSKTQYDFFYESPFLSIQECNENKQHFELGNNNRLSADTTMILHSLLYGMICKSYFVD